DDMAHKAMAALDAGYILTAFKPPNHEVVVLGYNIPDPRYPDSGYFIGPDSLSQNAESAQHNFGSIYIDVVVRNVVYKNQTLGPKPTPMPKPGVIVTPTPPSVPIPTGNAMTVPLIQAWATSLVPGQITQAQVDTGHLLAAQLVVDAVTTP